MRWRPTLPELGTTFLTLTIAALGAGLATLLHFPAPPLTGPALAVTLAGLTGMRLDVIPLVRAVTFLVVGAGLGSIVTAETTAALTKWPLAFVVMTGGLVVTMMTCQWILCRFYDFDRRAAVLASTPGHLSFVIGLGTSLDVDMTRVTIVQSLRLLTMSLLVPFLALLFGVEVTLSAVSSATPLNAGELFVLLVCAGLAGWGLAQLHMPAAMMVGAMVVSATAHGFGWVSGGLHPAVAAIGFIVLGALIGTRFSGVRLGAVLQAMGAGVATTLVGSAVAALAAIPVAAWLDMPTLGIVAAFAPGGFEMMIALGSVLGANPGLVAACHLVRLLILTVLVPLFLARARRAALS
ncbi:MAG: AbrB family transcriptional regulator [Rhodobacteraceae bacterium]|nr:AbrB family transcriptional regulator [Paracoccaceae bacterium]